MLQDLFSTFTRMAPYRFVGEVIPCDLCGETARDVVGRRDRYGNQLQTSLCQGCGLVSTSPMPTDDEVNTFYRRFYRKKYHNAFRPTGKALLRAKRGAKGRHDRLAPVLAPGMKVLDVGAASGNFVHYMDEKGYDAEGIEPNEGFADFAQREYGVKIQNAIWQEAQIAEQSVDLITANHVVEHFRSPTEALETFWRWLKPGGYLFVSVPNVYNPNRTPYGRFHFAHLYNFTPQTLEMLALKTGYRVETDKVSGGTDLLLIRTDQPAEKWQVHADSYSMMRDFFAIYTNRRYFFSTKPYTRWVSRMRRLGGDMIRAKGA
jgi:2-polyprenyl-3-methyl-5-hydroxy-6-metoxy-1,4-benzoquinol methylase